MRALPIYRGPVFSLRFFTILRLRLNAIVLLFIS
ncbi:hypothetical protein [Klebsiella phage vB_KpnS_Uniso31]|uniref:Uncharacterized protein n=1 Tax=Klebsiella phage vB_KpnS_Uniso31 TaxID=2951200 RepID=A0A9E7NFK3_9CAUD|nr:hypothetical protein [Klebsiella phage vB_KpnS_Uniso31]